MALSPQIPAVLYGLGHTGDRHAKALSVTHREFASVWTERKGFLLLVEGKWLGLQASVSSFACKASYLQAPQNST